MKHFSLQKTTEHNCYNFYTSVQNIPMLVNWRICTSKSAHDKWIKPDGPSVRLMNSAHSLNTKVVMISNFFPVFYFLKQFHTYLCIFSIVLIIKLFLLVLSVGQYFNCWL